MLNGKSSTSFEMIQAQLPLWVWVTFAHQFKYRLKKNNYYSKLCSNQAYFSHKNPTSTTPNNGPLEIWQFIMEILFQELKISSPLFSLPSLLSNRLWKGKFHTITYTTSLQAHTHQTGKSSVCPAVFKETNTQVHKHLTIGVSNVPT